MRTPPDKEFFAEIYQTGPPPWDIERSQSGMVAAFDELSLAGSALDLGCGTGEHVLELARRGVKAWGVDATAEAITQAEAKRDAQGIDRALAVFRCGDALDLVTLGRTFDTVLDSGLFHVISESDRQRYVREVTAITEPGAQLLMLGFQANDNETGPRGYTPAQLGDYLGDGWAEQWIRPNTYETRPDHDDRPAWLSLFIRRAQR